MRNIGRTPEWRDKQSHNVSSYFAASLSSYLPLYLSLSFFIVLLLKTNKTALGCKGTVNPACDQTLVRKKLYGIYKWNGMLCVFLFICFCAQINKQLNENYSLFYCWHKQNILQHFFMFICASLQIHWFFFSFCGMRRQPNLIIEIKWSENVFGGH